MLTYISSNKYYRSAYGAKLRAFLADNLTIQHMIDFGDAPVFEAIAYASILLGIKAQAEPDHSLKGYTWQADDSLPKVTDIVAGSAFTIRQEKLQPDGWRLESREAIALLEKIRAKGWPLGEYVGGRFYYGIKTGLNEAFVVDRATRDKLIAEDPKSAEVLKPFLRGKDVKRWKANFAEQYLIKIESSENAPHPWSNKPHDEAEKIFKKTYPAIHAWFQNFRDALIKRYDQGHFFWELRACVYWKEFEKSKLVIPAIERQCAFALDEKGFFSNDKTSICVSEDALFLCAILNSPVIWWVIQQTAASRQNGYFEFKPMYLTPLPIPDCSTDLKMQLSELAVSAAKSAGVELEEIERQIETIVYRLFDLTPSEITLIQNSLSPQELPGGLDNKTALTSRIIPSLKKQSAYFSLEAVKRTLAAVEVELADDTLREYMSEAMASGIVGDAGRGWYSRHSKPLTLDSKPVGKLIRSVAKAFPLLDFCCWSTIQLNPFAQYLIAQPTAFLYAEGDTLKSVVDHLRHEGWDAWPNPGKNETEQFVRPGENTVILRPSIAKQPTGINHLAPMEKVLVDLKIEAAKLKLMDEAEVQRIMDTAFGAGLLQLTVLLGYAETKREEITSHEITH